MRSVAATVQAAGEKTLEHREVKVAPTQARASKTCCGLLHAQRFGLGHQNGVHHAKRCKANHPAAVRKTEWWQWLEKKERSAPACWSCDTEITERIYSLAVRMRVLGAYIQTKNILGNTGQVTQGLFVAVFG